MSWWKRIREGITTSTREKKETPDGIWYKCPNCKAAITIKTLLPIYMSAHSVVITTALIRLNISTSFLIKNPKFFLMS